MKGLQGFGEGPIIPHISIYGRGFVYYAPIVRSVRILRNTMLVGAVREFDEYDADVLESNSTLTHVASVSKPRSVAARHVYRQQNQAPRTPLCSPQPPPVQAKISGNFHNQTCLFDISLIL